VLVITLILPLLGKPETEFTINVVNEDKAPDPLFVVVAALPAPPCPVYPARVEKS
jgi:hypothetical protein